MAAEGDNFIIIRYIFTGAEDEEIPENVTHLIIHESITIIPVKKFYGHPNITEVHCHVNVKRIRGWAFYRCPRLKRVVMNGVEVVDGCAFCDCEALEYIECDNLERIEWAAFSGCKSLSSINLKKVKAVGAAAFHQCEAMTEAKFDKCLESLRAERIFRNCRSLERITIPLNNGLITHDSIFQGCDKLNRVDLLQEVHDTIDALLYAEWRDELNFDISSFHKSLSIVDAGGEKISEKGEKAHAIREWIPSLLCKIVAYKVQHQRLLKEAVVALLLVSPKEIVMDHVLPYLILPAHRFDGEDEKL